MNIQQLMQQAQKMQKKMQENQKNMETTIFEGLASNGSVKVIMNGNCVVKNVFIQNELLNPEDVELLQDLLVIAFNDGKKKIDNANKDNLGNMAGALNGLM